MDKQAPSYYIKVRDANEKRFGFINHRGYKTSRKIFAARIDTLEKAEALCKGNMEVGRVWKIVNIETNKEVKRIL